MLLHLIRDQKFIDSARSVFEQASPQENKFIVIGNSSDLRFIHSFTPKHLTLAASLDPKFLKSLSEYNAVFLHSLSNTFRVIVDAAPTDVNFVWLGWGYDYYHLIDEPENLLLPATTKVKKKLDTLSRRPYIKLKRLRRKIMLAAAQPAMAPRALRAELRLSQVKAGGPKEDALLNKISTFAPVLKNEYQMIKSKHPELSLEFASWNYGLSENFDPFNQTYDKKSHALRVLIGNSASLESNHFDAFAWLVRTGFKGEIICPLSYGDMNYRKMVMRRGESLFGSNFHPITSFLPSNEYAYLIASSSYLIMNHVRQQGLGNIIIGLCSGTRVILRKENPIYAFMEDLGIEVSTFENDFTFLTSRQKKSTTDKNCDLLKGHFGPASRLRRTRLLIEKSIGMVRRQCD